MFSKEIFKQSIKANWKLWLIITIVGSGILSGFVISYDATGYASIAAAAKGTAFSNFLSSMTSLLGSLENFYKLIAVILGIVYVVFTANALVVSEVDSGSMAYTLSTPIKRSSVIFTKTLFLILSIIAMYSIISFSGLLASQSQYQNVTGYAITDDIKEAAKTLNQDERYLSKRLYLIQDDKQALREAAAARDMDSEAYSIYLASVINDRSYEEAAKIITDNRDDLYADDMDDDEIEITAQELMQDPAMILNSNDALSAGALIQGMSSNEYRQYVLDEIAALEENNNLANNEVSQDSKVTITKDNSKLLLETVVDTSAKTLNISSDQVNENLSLAKDSKALKAASSTTSLKEEQIINLINQTMISSARSEDTALDFDLEAYMWLSLGLLSLILAMSSIAFFASTLFNTTNLALTFGGGLPFAFFLITMIQQLMDDSSIALEYLTITTLFDTDAILANNEFGYGLLALVTIALILYTASNIIFTKKDLPL